MKTVKVHLGPRSYSIYIGKGVISRIPSLLEVAAPNTPLFVITNKKINTLHGKRLKKALKKISKKILFYEVPDSERSKSFPVYIKTIRRLARFARKTKPIVFTFGGGVIGDLGGFVASAYRRGVPYVQIPTTLLAQVDSAIGGKVAIDINEAKNIVGDFYQPEMVISELGFLKTLPERQLRNGLAEVVKYGIIKDSSFFAFLEKNISKVLKVEKKAVERVVFTSCKIKAGVVEKDELDTKDLRAVLNFGHTIGHAIEAASGYSKRLMHGEAVAEGMDLACQMALELGMIKPAAYRRISALIRTATTGTKKATPLKTKDILEKLSYDKKFIRGQNRFVLPVKIGSVKVVTNVPQTLVKKIIERRGYHGS
ncbi:3-dehydroquinate synthase [Candidatus Omnitrophota bacterium]